MFIKTEKDIMYKFLIRFTIVAIGLLISRLTFAITPKNIDIYSSIKGEIHDAKTKIPVEYATVGLYKAVDNSVVTGTVTNEDGEFTIEEVKYGNYYIVVSFLGYNEKRYDNIEVKKEQNVIDLGLINMGESTELLDEIEVVGERQSIEFKIDKKIVSVGKQMTSAALSAVEVLENVPSIRVDIEGNVSLRGSTGFTVLIDGKPTILDPSDVLRQTPASTIDNIEIITNPSAKYQPDGTGGIINIITKKNRMLGLQGLFNLKGGSFGQYGGDFLLNWRKNTFNFHIGGDYNYRPGPSTLYSERRTKNNDTTTIIQAEGENERNFKKGGVRVGIDWDLTENNLFSIGIRMGRYKMTGNSDLDYLTTQTPGGYNLLQRSENESFRGGDYYSVTGNYSHKFAQKGHSLIAQVNYREFEGKESAQNLLSNLNLNPTIGTKTTEDGPSKRLELRLDYAKPIGETDKFEAGFQGRKGISQDATTISVFDTNTEDFIMEQGKNNAIDYTRNIYGLYSTYNGYLGDWGYQMGMRGEYTDRVVQSITQKDTFSIDRLDYFPTLHLSYQLPAENQLMASYSRRIDRPRSYYLEPFITWTDMYNVRSGNPDLLPEYIDAMELSYLKKWELSQLSVEAYYRITHNKVERIHSVYEEGILIHSFSNVGTDYSLGIDLMYNFSLFEWWELNMMGNVYDYRIAGVKNDKSFEQRSFNWSNRLSNTFRFNKYMQFQLDGNYNSPTVRAQGDEEGYYAINSAFKTSFFDRRFSVVIQARNIFNTAQRVSTTYENNFYNYHESARKSPVLSFTLSYRLNNFRLKKSKLNNEMDDDF